MTPPEIEEVVVAGFVVSVDDVLVFDVDVLVFDVDDVLSVDVISASEVGGGRVVKAGS